MKIKKTYPLVISAFLVLFLFVLNHFFIINITPSMPEGLYLKQKNTTIKRGNIVLACLPDPYKTQGLERGYLQKGVTCHGSIALVKTVLAVPGDHVQLLKKTIIVNSIQYAYATLAQDSQGRTLSSIPRGTYFATHGYWLLGTQAVNSWDSRYWGPLPPQAIIGSLRPLLTWHSDP